MRAPPPAAAPGKMPLWDIMWEKLIDADVRFCINVAHSLTIEAGIACVKCTARSPMQLRVVVHAGCNLQRTPDLYAADLFKCSCCTKNDDQASMSKFGAFAVANGSS